MKIVGQRKLRRRHPRQCIADSLATKKSRISTTRAGSSRLLGDTRLTGKFAVTYFGSTLTSPSMPALAKKEIDPIPKPARIA